MRVFRLLFMIVAFMALTASIFAADQKADDLFQARCQGCHGPDGRASLVGKKMGAKDFQDPAVIKMSRIEIQKVIAEGKNKMPPYKGKLTDDEIKALAKYIKEMK